MNPQKIFLAVSGTSGSGKTTLVNRLLANYPNVSRLITSTTRNPRKGEIDGQDYHFLNKETFQNGLNQSAFVEHAEVYGNYYGLSKKEIINQSYTCKDLIVCLDVQGIRSLQGCISQLNISYRLVCVFVSPPSIEDLRQRLIMRGTDDEQTIQKRLQTAERELETLSQFDYYLRSQDRESDWHAMQSIYLTEKMRI